MKGDKLNFEVSEASRWCSNVVELGKEKSVSAQRWLRDGGPVGDLLGGLPFNRGPSVAATSAEQPMPH